MNFLSTLQSFALNEEGRLVSVNEVNRGAACKCTCPACHQPVVARQGEVRTWHFAHAAGLDCAKGTETALHLASKQIIEKRRGLMLPAYGMDELEGLNADPLHAPRRVPETWVDFEAVSLEETLGSIRPDVIGTVAGRRYIIEVAVTHAVDESKRTFLMELGDPAVEIDLRLIERETWDWASLEKVVIDESATKKWIFYPNALRSTITSQVEPSTKAVLPTAPKEKIKFVIRGMFVTVTEYPEYLTLWMLYNPEITPIISSLARSLGGRWKKKYRNWLFQVCAKETLLRKLEQLSHT